MAIVTGLDLLIGYRLAPHFPALPRDIAKCMFYTGMDPFTKKQVGVARGMHDRKLQRALMQFFKPENYYLVREALLQAGRGDLIGAGCDALIPADPPKEAIQARRKNANADHYHAMATAKKKQATPNRAGYRPGRATQVRRDRPGLPEGN